MRQLFARKSVSVLAGEAASGAHGLKRVLGKWDLTALGVGAIIGAGIFATTGTAIVGETSITGDVVRLGAGPATHPSATGRGAAPLLAYGSRPMPRGERPRRSSCTSIIRSMETRFTEPRTPIPLVATIARPGPRCCARARGVSSTDRCPRKLRAMNAADPEQAHGSSGMRLRSGRRRSGSHGCDSDEKPTTCAVLERA